MRCDERTGGRRTARSAALMVILLSSGALACGGGRTPKGPPMAPDPSTSEVSSPEDGPNGQAEDGGAPDASSPEVPSSGPVVQGNEEGALALLKQFVSPNADHAALTRSLRPTSADYRTLFDAPLASRIEAVQTKDWDSGKAVIKPKPSQTEVKLWSATGADLAAGKGSSKAFSGGYAKIGKHLAPGVTFFRFKFVEPGKETGTAYDGLAFVNGHWVIAPKPWRAMDGTKGDDNAEEAGGSSGEPAPPPKPKPKPKGKPKRR